jgi:hypothetical protein
LVSLALGTQVREFTGSFQNDWNIERTKAADVQLAKRNEMWLIWFQQILRWVIGGWIAIFIHPSYSFKKKLASSKFQYAIGFTTNQAKAKSWGNFGGNSLK